MKHLNWCFIDTGDLREALKVVKHVSCITLPYLQVRYLTACLAKTAVCNQTTGSSKRALLDLTI